jgi:hypothetical protein
VDWVWEWEGMRRSSNRYACLRNFTRWEGPVSIRNRVRVALRIRAEVPRLMVKLTPLTMAAIEVPLVLG